MSYPKKLKDKEFTICTIKISELREIIKESKFSGSQKTKLFLCKIDDGTGKRYFNSPTLKGLFKELKKRFV